MDGLVTGQHEQVLRVPAHPDDKVLHRGELGTLVGILLALPGRLHHLRQPLDQRLAAPGQADEHGADALAQHGLVARQPDRLGVHEVEGAGDLADLIGGVHGDRLDAEVRGRVPGLAQFPHPGRQARRGDIQRARPQPP